jgi:hypothetical protein
VERYGHRLEEERLPKEDVERTQYANQVGADGWTLLDALQAACTPDWMQALPAVTTLRTMWEHQFETREQGGQWRKEPALPAAQLITSPYDLDARNGKKRSTFWTGNTSAFHPDVSELTKALNNGVYGTADNSGSIKTFEVWIRGRNKDLYTRDGNLSFDQDDAGEWYNYWSTLRKNVGCPPMTVQLNLDLTGGPADSSVIEGNTVYGPLWSNQFEAFQTATTNQLGLTNFPNGAARGIYLKTSQMLSISSATRYPTVAAELISFLINDVNAVKVLGFERGIPGSAKGLATLQARLTPKQKVILNYMDQVKNTYTRPKEVLDPPGAGKVQDLLLRFSQEIGLGHLSVSDGAKEFYAQAKKAVTPS